MCLTVNKRRLIGSLDTQKLMYSYKSIMYLQEKYNYSTTKTPVFCDFPFYIVDNLTGFVQILKVLEST